MSSYSALVEYNKNIEGLVQLSPAIHFNLLIILNYCYFFVCLFVFGANSPKCNIEESDVNSDSKASTPKYKILREPPQGRPEFLVIEIVLPGIVSMQV